MNIISDEEQSIAEAALMVRHGGLVAYPTEAMFGVGCDPWSEDAVTRLLALKKRPIAMGLIILASSWKALGGWVKPLTDAVKAELDATWPGAMTWLLPNHTFPKWVTGDHETVAVRMTAHPVASALCELSGGLLVSSSANLTGEQPFLTANAVRDAWGSDLDFIVDGALTYDHAMPTPIRDACTGAWVRRSEIPK